MYIVLDTNIFFDHWHLRSPEFVRLIEHANRVSATVLISQVVVEEANSKYQEHWSTFLSNLNSLTSTAKRLLPHPDLEWPQPDTTQSYDLLSVLKSFFYSVECVSYDRIGHGRLLNKAIRAERPFQKNEKGYRDALFWLTIIDYLEENRSDRHVAFITKNRNDFFAIDTSKGFKLHEHLEADWDAAKLENKLLLFSKLSEFNENLPHPTDGTIDINEFQEAHSDLIEESLLAYVGEYLEGPGTLELLQHLCLPNLVVESSRWNIVEDFEDTEILQIIPLSNSISYVQCRFNLRAVYVSLTVALDVYNAHKRDVDLDFQRITTNGDLVELEIGLRCYMIASALVDTKRNDVSEIDFEIEHFRS